MLGALLAIAVLAGGGGSPYPLPELLVQLAAIAVLVAVVATRVALLRSRLLRDRIAVVLLALLCAVPLIQLIPLPPAIFGGIPGREAIYSMLAEAGVPEGGWSSISLSTGRTISALLALLPPAAAIAAWAVASHAQRMAALVVLVGLGVAGAVLGLAQFGGADSLYLYSYTNNGFATGFFANRNAHADFLAIALCALILLAGRDAQRRSSPVRMLAFATGAALLIAGSLATGSRTGIAMLLVPAVLAVATGSRAARKRELSRKTRLFLLVAAAGAAACVLTLALTQTALSRTGDRFATQGERRVAVWQDSFLVVPQFWPLGVGAGAFVPAYQMIEQLDNVRETHTNRAHNDYLESLIEFGAAAPAIWLALLGFIFVRARRRWTSGSADDHLLVHFAVGATVIIALHSIVDYPLRTLALLTLAGVPLASLMGESSGDGRPAGD